MIEILFAVLMLSALGFADTGMNGLADEIAGAMEEAPANDQAVERAPEPQIADGSMTSAIEIRMIMDVTKPNWIVVREWDGQDLVYFTQVLAWRCGLWAIRYGVNGAPPDTTLPMEPCYEDTASPNAMSDTSFLPYVAFPLGSVESVSVEIVYDDGTRDTHSVTRAEVLMP